jgi:ADP-L-glycero-D-manno-heptose 6-epimerase
MGTMKTILITGGGGFIGSNIAASLNAGGQWRVAVCDKFGSGDKWRNLAKHPPHEIVAPQDLFYWLEMRAEEIEAVVHMGAISSTTERDVDLILENNFSLSAMLWRWCAENETRFIYASSAATYGDGEAGFDDDVSLPALEKLRPLNPYGWSKQLFDCHVSRLTAAGEKAPPQWAGLKFFNVYGPNEHHKGDQMSVLCKLAPHAISGEAVKLFKSYNAKYPDGGQLRDFVYVKDCVRVVEWLLATPNVSGLFNVGTGKARSFKDLAAAMFAAIGKSANISYIDMPAELAGKYQYFTEAKMDRLRAAGYTTPFTSLEDGVKEYVQQYLVKEDPYL